MILFLILVFAPVILFVGAWIYGFFVEWYDIHRFRVRAGETLESKKKIRQEEKDNAKVGFHILIGSMKEFGFWFTLPGFILCWCVLRGTDSKWDLIDDYAGFMVPAWRFVNEVPYSFWIMIAVLVGIHFLLKRVDTHLYDDLGDDDSTALDCFYKDRKEYESRVKSGIYGNRKQWWDTEASLRASRERLETVKKELMEEEGWTREKADKYCWGNYLED